MFLLLAGVLQLHLTFEVLPRLTLSERVLNLSEGVLNLCEGVLNLSEGKDHRLALQPALPFHICHFSALVRKIMDVDLLRISYLYQRTHILQKSVELLQG